MLINYSTDSVKSQERFDYWKESVCTHLIRAEAFPEEPKHFAGRMKFRSFAGIDVATQVCDKQIWSRTARCLKQDPEDDFWLGYMEKGQGRLEQNNNVAIIGDGQMVIYDAAQAFQYQYQTQGMHIVRLQRKMIEKRAPNIATMTGKILDPSRPGMSPLRQMLLEAVSDPFEQEASFLTQDFADTLFDLIALSIKFQQTDSTPPRQETLYSRMLSYIRQNMGDSELSLRSIAEAHHVSTRTVTRVFARQDKTPMNAVWQERLNASHKALSTRHSGNVTQIALDHGFSDMSHFSQAFRRAFGYSPSAALNRSITP